MCQTCIDGWEEKHGLEEGCSDGIEYNVDIIDFTEEGYELGCRDGSEDGSTGARIPPPHTQHAKYVFFPFVHTSLKSPQKLSDISSHP